MSLLRRSDRSPSSARQVRPGSRPRRDRLAAGTPRGALIGDGSALYTIQSLWTAAHDGIAVVFVICNNASYRILKQRTLALKGFAAQDDRCIAMDLVNPAIDFVGLARSLGVPGEAVEKTPDIGAALARGLALGGPYLIDVRIDGSFKG